MKQNNVVTLKEILPPAERGRYAVGAFSCRTLPYIRAVIRAAEKLRSPFIVQISNNETKRYGFTFAEFAQTFFDELARQHATVPAVLHLDHTREIAPIHEAIQAGFTSVMIDASAKELDENIAITRAVVAYAHAHQVSVEAELGRIGTTDRIETDGDEELYTKPAEAERFVRETNVDALAISVGTAHGVYNVRQPKIDYARLRAIRARTNVHLVLHGGSGVPAEMVARALTIEGGGISKMNIATDLERAALKALQCDKTLTNPEMLALPPAELERALAAVEAEVSDKMINFVKSAGKA
jgi:fructose-bisphosphate aldolase class II